MPICVIIIVNCIVFSLISRKHCFPKANTRSNESKSKRQTIIVSTCFVNMGLTWSLAFLLLAFRFENVTKTIVSFLFCFFNSLQGFWLFFVYVVMSKSRRNMFQSTAGKKLNTIKSFFSTNSNSQQYDMSKTSSQSATKSTVVLN